MLQVAFLCCTVLLHACAAEDTVGARANFPQPPPVLTKHPRLRLTDEALVKLKTRIASISFDSDVAAGLFVYGTSLLNEPVVNCTRQGVENSLLTQARAVLDRTYTLYV